MSAGSTVTRLHSAPPFADGAISTATGAVGLAAVVPGAEGNDLQDGATSAQTLTWFQSVTLTSPTSGGVDAEGDDEYLDRLADTRPLQSQAIANAGDLARWLRNQPGVYRALAIDNYSTETGYGAPGHVLGIPIDANGSQLSGGALTALQTAAQQVTLTNLIVHIDIPIDNPITVVYEGVAESGYDPGDVKARTDAAILDFLSRVTFGAPTGLDPRLWNEKLIIRWQDLSAVLNGVVGFDHHDVLTINGAAVDRDLAGPAALPAPNPTVTGTVVAP
jgi:hypothetical protein